MKKASIWIVCLLAATALSFFIGNYMSDQEHLQDKAELGAKLISIAIDTVEDKGLSTEGAKEFVASNVWAAHELCDDPETSAELSDLWNTLVYDEDTYVGQEDTLVTQLKDILQQFQ